MSRLNTTENGLFHEVPDHIEIVESYAPLEVALFSVIDEKKPCLYREIVFSEELTAILQEVTEIGHAIPVIGKAIGLVHEGGKIAYYELKESLWKTLADLKPYLPCNTPLLPRVFTRERELLIRGQYPLPIHIHTHVTMPAVMSPGDVNVFIPLHRKLGLPYVSHIVVNREGKLDLRLLGKWRYDGNIYGAVLYKPKT